VALVACFTGHQAVFRTFRIYPRVKLVKAKGRVMPRHTLLSISSSDTLQLDRFMNIAKSWRSVPLGTEDGPPANVVQTVNLQ
jgi:hypothetical protein